MADSSQSDHSGCDNIEQDAFISIRLVTMHYYITKPLTSELDPIYSSFRSSPIKRVPVLQVFGPTASGQKACLHLHGILPYMFVPKPDGADDSFPYRLVASLDKALNISLLAGLDKVEDEQNQQHIYKIAEVRACPFYGYHPRHSTAHFLQNIFLQSLAAEKSCCHITKWSSDGENIAAS